MIIVTLRNIICITGLIFIAPFLFFMAIIILLEDGLPVFFKQNRLGLRKKTFTIYKIRTMKKNTPELGTHEIENVYKLSAGIMARKLKIDEFPQLINVIKGEINLVGPRPGLKTQRQLEAARSLHGIFEIKPGITGLAQILGYDMSNPGKLAEVDKIYMINRSLKIDLLILLGTFVKFPRKYLSAQLNVPMLEE